MQISTPYSLKMIGKFCVGLMEAYFCDVKCVFQRTIVFTAKKQVVNTKYDVNVWVCHSPFQCESQDEIA